MTQAQDEIKKALVKFKDLPALSDVVAKVMRIVANPFTSASDLNQVISFDQALTFKVLRLANSAYYGFPHEINTITQAVTILGFNTLRNLALSISVHKMLFSEKEKPHFSHRDFWKHCVGTAVASRLLAKRIGYKSEDNAFTAGLLHDIGKSVLDKVMHEEFMKALQYSKQYEKPLWEAEQKFCGVTHTYVGGLLAEIWNLPTELKFAMEHHHDLEWNSDMDILAAIVHAANEFCREGSVGSAGDFGPLALRDDVRKLLDLNVESQVEISRELNERMKEAEDFLKIQK